MKSILLSVVLLLSLVFSIECEAQETSHYDVVVAFVKLLVDTKNCQDIASHELAETEKLKLDWYQKSQQNMMDIIRQSMRTKLKLQENNLSLKSMSLIDPKDLIPNINFWIETKIKLYEEMGEIAKSFVGGPKPDADYSKLSTRMPEITAEMEYADESIFKMTVLVFSILIDRKPDSKDHLSHLIITKVEGDNIIKKINNNFGSSLDEKNQNWTVSSASVLRTYLTKNHFKFSDDPWE